MTDDQQFKFSLNIPVSRIYAFLKLIAVVNILFLTGTWLSAEKVILPTNPTAQWWFVEFNFAKENVAAAWYSSMLFFTTGIVAALCFWADMQRTGSKGRLLNYGWLIMACIFFMLSFDEMGSFHEMISQTGLFKKAGGGHGKLVFFALIGVVALFMAAFFFTKFKTDKLALLLTIIGLLLFLSNPFQEKFEIQSWRISADPDNWRRPVFYLLLEEGSEIFASFCFLFSFITYAINAAPGDKALHLESSANNNIIIIVAVLACLLGFGMWVIHANAWNIPGDDNGVPQDWPPAAIAFAGCIGAFYLYFKKQTSNKFIYLLLALVCLFTSAYYGSYMYGFFEGPFVKMPYLFLLLTSIAALAAIFTLKGWMAKLLFLAWAGFMALSVFTKGFSSTVYGYAGSACLLLALFIHYKVIASSQTTA